jgi:hypothetical protein
MRARTSPQVLHAQPFDGILARYASMATGECRNITRTDTHGYGLRVQVRPYRAAGTRGLGLRQNWTAPFEE